MGLKENWVDKRDNVDYVRAKDINDIAHAVIDQEEEFSTFTKISVYGAKGEAVETINKAGAYIFDLYMYDDPSDIESNASVKVVIGNEIGVPYYSDKKFYFCAYGGDTIYGTVNLAVQRTSNTEYKVGVLVGSDWEDWGQHLADENGIVWFSNIFDSDHVNWTIYTVALQERADFDELMKQYGGGSGGTVDLSNYYTKQQTYSRNEIDAIYGDVEASLDEIIEIQESLIGGASV